MNVTWKRFVTRLNPGPVIGLIFLTILILLPRTLPFPPLFLTSDEMQIAQWIAQMSRGVLTGQLEETVNNAYPGVTLMWVDVAQISLRQILPGQQFTVEQMLADTEQSVFAVLPQRRLALGLINGLIVIAIFGLLRRLYNNFVAVAATLLIALDPFPLVQARIVRTEGLNAGWMMLSALAILIYAKERKKGWLILSGILAGWATLTKFTSIYLLPFTGLVLLVWLWGQKGLKNWPMLKRAGLDLLLWSLMLAVTFFASWPALWVSPLKAFTKLSAYMQAAVGTDLVWGSPGAFFGGEVVTEGLGFSFYLWSLAYKTTPIVWLGCLLALGGSVAILLSRRPGSYGVGSLDSLTNFRQGLAPSFLLLGYIIFYLVAMSVGKTKVDHYLQPLFAPLAILAAFGFWGIVELFSLSEQRLKLVQGGIWGGLLVSSLWFSLPHHPYYFTYWNPLLGGGQAAAKQLPIWSLGGSELLVAQLNALPNVQEISLTGPAIYRACPLTFKGNCLAESDFLASDYFMINTFAYQVKMRLSNIQRLVPDIELVSKYGKDGVDYVWLYKMPEGLRATDQWLTTHGQFKGYRLSATELGAGQPLEVTLFWLNGEQGWTMTDSEFFVKLLDQTGQVQQVVPAQLKPEFTPYLAQPAEFLVFTATLPLPVDITPGLYPLEIGLRLKEGGAETWHFSLEDLSHTITVDRGALDIAVETLPIEHRLDERVGETGLVLLGYNDLTRNQPPRVELYWQVHEVLEEEYMMDLKLLDGQGKVVASWQQPLSSEIHPLSRWQQGEIVKISLPLTLGPEIRPGAYHPVLSIFPRDGQPSQPAAQISLLP